jgi:hypothetical protein
VLDGVQQGGKYDPGDRTLSRGEGRASELLSTINNVDRPMFSAECQAEKRGLAISLLYKFEPRTLNERFLWNA